MKKLAFIFLTVLLLISCTEEKQLPSEIAEIPIDLKVKRFDLAFAKADTTQLASLKKTYPYLFPQGYADDFWKAKMTDTLQIEINAAVREAFPEVIELTEEISTLYKHINYYFPKSTVPEVITITSDVDYRNKIILTEPLLLIALDTYLGEDHRFYTGIPAYQSKNFRPAQVVVDIAEVFAEGKVAPSKTNTFLERMIYEGKKLYLMDRLLTLKEAHEIFGYTEEELQYAQENEINIWQYMIAGKLLYSTDIKLSSRFIEPAPFSKFYLEFDNETPGRLGRYIGYQIVRSYMDTNDIPLHTMLGQDAQEIFTNAKYKP